MQCSRCGFESPPGFKFCGACGAPLETPDLASLPPQLEPTEQEGARPVNRPFFEKPSDLRAERRQLTVMFCDIVGSTALSVELDAEDLREVVKAYQQVCARCIDQFGGYIAQYLGDGILVYFGYPAAHEDAAERALHAGLDILRGIEELSFGQDRAERRPLAVRIGVHSGLVVVGEMGSGLRREQLAIGEVPNLAARLQSIAEPNTLLISGTTHRLVAGRFECKDLGPHEFKGLSRTENVYRLEGIREWSSASGGFGSNEPLLRSGRTQEIDLLMDRWARACRGTGQVVTVCGEAGIGKSHLIQLFKQSLDGAFRNTIEFRCSPYHQNTPFYPLVDLLRRVLNFYPGQPPEEQLDMLTLMLERNGFSVPEALPLFADFLNVPLQEGSAPLSYTPQVRKEKTVAALVQLFVKLSEEHPFVFLVEDLHWVDLSTLALIRQFVDQVAEHHILALLIYRPTFSGRWAPEADLTPITLKRLGRNEVERIIREVAGGKRLPEEIVDEIVSKTDGIPLFVRELTRMVIESEQVTEHKDRFELAGEVPHLAVPATLQDSLMARLDRLAPIKEVAQLCATLGREFSYELLAAVSRMNEDTLQAALVRLVDAELLYIQGQPPTAKYLFRQALIQEVAYESLLKSQRQQYHRRTAEQIEQRFPRVVADEPELLAYHFSQAGMSEEAAPYWYEAGLRALKQSANAEAIENLTKGISLLDGLSETPERMRLSLLLKTNLASAMQREKGYAHPDVKEAYQQARDLSRRAGHGPEGVAVLHGLWTYYTGAGAHSVAADLAQQLLAVTEPLGDEVQRLEAKRAVASSLYWRGEVTAARDLLEQALYAHEAVKEHPPPALFADHPTVSCLSYLSHAHWYLGHTDLAIERAREALVLAQALEHPFSIAYALGFGAGLCAHLNDRAATLAKAEAVVEISRTYGFSFWLGVGTILRAWSRIEEEPEQGLRAMREGIAAFQQAGVQVWIPHPVALLAHELGQRVSPEEGLRLINGAIEAAQTNQECNHLPELYRIHGELLLALGQSGGAAKSLHRALELAQHHRMKALEVRARASLNRTGL